MKTFFFYWNEKINIKTDSIKAPHHDTNITLEQKEIENNISQQIEEKKMEIGIEKRGCYLRECYHRYNQLDEILISRSENTKKARSDTTWNQSSLLAPSGCNVKENL